MGSLVFLVIACLWLGLRKDGGFRRKETNAGRKKKKRIRRTSGAIRMLSHIQSRQP